MKIKTYNLILVLFLVSCTVTVSLAEPAKTASDPAGNTGKQTSLTSTNDSPVIALVPDGMYILLLLAGGYGVSKYFQVRKQSKIV
jgi:hypothetical protein